MISSPLPDVDIPDNVPLSKFVLDRARKFGDKVAMVDFHTDQQITFLEIVTQSQAVGSALWRRGFRKGDVMMMYSPNCIEYVVMFHAVVGQGGVISTCNHLFTAEELENQCCDSKAVYIFTHQAFMNNVTEVRRRYPNIKAVITVDDVPGTWSYSVLKRDNGAAFPEVKIDARNDVAVLPYSSGTTGKPKGVMLTHYNLVANTCQGSPKELGVIVPGSRLLFVMPFFHIYGIMVCMQYSLCFGNFVAILRQYNLKDFLTAIEKYKATLVYTVPPILVELTKDPLINQYDLSSMTHLFCGAAPTSKEIVLAARKRFPHVQSLGIGYGMTELSPMATATLPGTWDYGAVGVPVPNTRIKIVDPETKKPLGPNQDGELVIKGPQVMKGYLGNPSATSASIDKDGWLYTGDLGHYDERGIFYVVDRIKELIKYKAYQVAPAELEDFLLKMPGVADAAVIGVPDEYAGELPRAFVVKKQGVDLTESQVIKHFQDHVAPQKRLHGGVEFVDAIPKSPSGKILHRLIRDQLRQRLKTKSKL